MDPYIIHVKLGNDQEVDDSARIAKFEELASARGRSGKTGVIREFLDQEIQKGETPNAEPGPIDSQQ